MTVLACTFNLRLCDVREKSIKMTDFDSYSSGTTENKGDKELQEFLMVEKQKAQFNAQVST